MQTLSTAAKRKQEPKKTEQKGECAPNVISSEVCILEVSTSKVYARDASKVEGSEREIELEVSHLEWASQWHVGGRVGFLPFL